MHRAVFGHGIAEYTVIFMLVLAYLFMLTYTRRLGPITGCSQFVNVVLPFPPPCVLNVKIEITRVQLSKCCCCIVVFVSWLNL